MDGLGSHAVKKRNPQMGSIRRGKSCATGAETKKGVSTTRLLWELTSA